jgi:hypothetical protein
MRGQQQGQRAQQHEEGEANGAQLDLEEVARVVGSGQREAGEPPLSGGGPREIYAGDTEPDDQPS